METAKIFKNGQSQAVRLPKKYRFSDEEVYINRIGKAVILVPKEKAWELFMEGINEFTDDFMADGRGPEIPSPREEF